MVLKRYAIFVFFMVIVVASGSNAQWKIVASNVFGAPTQYGKMYFSHGSLWLAGTQLWMSPDTGKSWMKRGGFTSDQIWDVRFFDSNNGVVGTVNGSVFKTSDRGLTWNVIKQNPTSGYVYSLCYANTKNDIIVANGNLGSISYTHDGGLTWQDVSMREFTLYLESTPSGTIYALTGDQLPNSYHLRISTDQGETWQEMPGAFDPDCFSFAVSCDENIIVAPNEAAAFAFDLESEPYVTTDKGVTWNSHAKYPKQFLAGSITHAESIFYIQSADEVMRSTDNGMTWKNIGGPGNTLDTRFLCALNANLVFALDKQGNLWSTTNSGGDSLDELISTGSISFLPKILFQNDTLVCIDSVVRSLFVKRTGCNPPSITSASLIGTDSSNYSILSITSDSICLSFDPQDLGASTASILIKLSNGSEDTISLTGFMKGTKYMSISVEDVSTDTLGGTVRIPISINGDIATKTIELVLHYDASADLIYSNSYAKNGTILDIPGQTWEGRSKLRLMNVLPNEIYGYSHFIVFSDSSRKPQVLFDSLYVLNSISPCEYDEPTAVSTVAPPQGCGINILSKFLTTGNIPRFFISPNPAENTLNIRSSESIDNVQFFLYDELGKTIIDKYYSVNTTEGVSIDVSSIPSGMYYLRIRSGQHTTTQLVVINH
jgi:photosystem II stability/assembly factor-like uncharacterized protein